MANVAILCGSLLKQGHQSPDNRCTPYPHGQGIGSMYTKLDHYVNRGHSTALVLQYCARWVWELYHQIRDLQDKYYIWFCHQHTPILGFLQLGFNHIHTTWSLHLYHTPGSTGFKHISKTHHIGCAKQPFRFSVVYGKSPDLTHTNQHLF